MSTMRIRINEGSTYTMELKDEYTPEEFIATFDSYIKIITLILSNSKKLQAEFDVSRGLDSLAAKVDNLETELKKSVDRVTAIMLTDDSSIKPDKD